MCYPTCLFFIVFLLKGLVILNVDKSHSNINANEFFLQKVVTINIRNELKSFTTLGGFFLVGDFRYIQAMRIRCYYYALTLLRSMMKHLWQRILLFLWQHHKTCLILGKPTFSKTFTTSLESVALKSNIFYPDLSQLFQYVTLYFIANDMQCWEHAKHLEGHKNVIIS